VSVPVPPEPLQPACQGGNLLAKPS
jgi:hypothetical protein